MDKNLSLSFVRVTEAAAIAAARWLGRGDKIGADGAAVEEMRSRFNQMDFRGTIVIGEGKKDEAPELYTGEKVGSGDGPEMDIAVDPLEATDSVAKGLPNALAVIVTGPKGTLLSAPDTYMDKIAIGPKGARAIKLDASVEENLHNAAKALNKEVTELTVVVLDRPRHETLISEIRRVGARVLLITDGDVAAAVATCQSGSGIDLLMGIGGSTEAVLAAAPVKIMGGEILCRFKPRSEADKKEIQKCGIDDLNRIFTAEDLARGDKLTFAATGVVTRPMLPGVLFQSDEIITHSMVLRGASKTLRYITTHHKNN